MYMGKLEAENKKQIRATKIQKTILATIAIAGVISIAAIAPNVLQILKLFNSDKKSKRNIKTSIYNSRRRLIENGLVEYTKNGFLALTPLGIKVLNKFERHEFKIEKPKKWDKKWRILIFDIQERKRLVRDQIRITLNQIGFVKLQNSVWVYPYDCEDLINLLKADFSIGKEVLYIIADTIENQKVLLNHFNLE